jgi:hypothetical protein
MSKNLSLNDRHFLRLIRKGQDADGWARVSQILWRFAEALPAPLVEIRKTDDGGFAKLTHDGNVVVDWT